MSRSACIEVSYISDRTGHSLTLGESSFLALPQWTTAVDLRSCLSDVSFNQNIVARTVRFLSDTEQRVMHSALM